MEPSIVSKPFDFMPQSEKDRRMQRWIITGDSRHLPVSIRHRDDLYELRYQKGDLLMLAYSGAWDGDVPKVYVKALKDGARKVLRDWLDRNDIPIGRVDVSGQEEKADYRITFRVQAVVKQPVSLFVPPWGDDWWEKLRC